MRVRRALALFFIPAIAFAADTKLPVSTIRHAGALTTWSCGLDNIAATLTQCQAAPAAGLKLYVVTVVAQSTTATGGQFLLRFGTGTNCATGTTSFLPSAATVARLGAAGNTAAPTVIKLEPPIAITAANAICAIGVATNTLTIQIVGFTAP